MLSINLRGSDRALRIVVTWICRKIYFILFIFSFFNRESLLPAVYDQPNNAATILSRPFSTAYANRAKFIHEFFLAAYVRHAHICTRVQIREVHRRYQRFTRRNIRTDGGAKREKRNSSVEREVDGGRGGGGGSSTSSTWRNEHTHTRAHSHTNTRARGDSKRIAPVTSSFRKWPLSRALEPLENPSRGPPSSVEFGVERESRELLAWLILPAIFPQITRSLVVSQPVNSMWQLIKRVIPVVGYFGWI